MGNGDRSFWTTLPGILTGLASLIMAVIALLAFWGLGAGNKQKPQVPVGPPPAASIIEQPENVPLENYTRIPKAGIEGHNIWKLTNVSIEDCARKCNKDPSCKSFDYHRIDRRCYGSDMSADDVGGLKTTYKGNPYDHYLKNN
jgi:hypothetical protein